MLEALIPPLLLFLPGYFLFDLPGLNGARSFTVVERLVVGGVLWSAFFVVLGYFVGVLSDYSTSYFGFFAALSTALLAWGAFTRVRRGLQTGTARAEGAVMAVLLLGLAGVLFSLSIAHQIYLEYDALFYYLPLAKSILLTGGLQSDFFHQSVVPTTIEPAMPLMYAFAGFVTNDTARIDLAARLIPFAYILLTAGAVYLTARDVLKSSMAGGAAAAVFLALPVTSAVSSNFSLYLDVPFVFYIAVIMYAMVKACTRGDELSWWMILGVSVASGLFERDILLFFVPAVVAIAGAVFLRRGTGLPSVWAAIGCTILFAGAYNFFMVYDLKFSSLSVADIVLREFPVLFIMGAFIALSGTRLRPSSRPGLKTLLLAAAALVPVGFLFLRNALASGVVTSNFVLPGSQLGEALQIISAAGRPSVTTTSLSQLFSWGTLFTSMQLGGVVLVPVVVGLVALVLKLAKGDESERTASLVVVAFFLATLLLWSWVFGSSFQGPELRRLYYFAPVMAVLAAAGLAFIAEKMKVGFFGLRAALFVGAAAGLFWYTQVGVTWGVSRASSVLDRLGSLTPLDFVLFTAVLVLAFFTFGGGPPPPGRETRSRTEALAVALAVVAVAAAVVFLSFNSATVTNAAPSTQLSAPSGWENGLYPVAQYLNQNQYNTYGIITTYSMPLAYLTPHPVIDSTTYYGVERLIALNSTTGDWSQQLLGGGIRYILMPTQGNSFYNYSVNIGENLTILNSAHIYSSPNVIVLKDFPSYTLFEIVPGSNTTSQYSYLTTFSQGWGPADLSSGVRTIQTGVVVTGGTEANYTLVGGAPTAFWSPAKALSSDSITLADAADSPAPGTTSLSIALNGTGNMVIRHTYQAPQDWSRYAFFSFYFYGQNTSKSVTFTFHTTEWKDYYAYAMKDNFLGWREVTIPLGAFSVHGDPDWSSISYTEFLMGGRQAVYMIGDLTLGGHKLGIEGAIPPVGAGTGTVSLAISVDNSAVVGGYAPYVLITSQGSQFSAALHGGVNEVSVPAGVLAEGATVEIYVPSFDPSDSFVLFYLGVLTP